MAVQWRSRQWWQTILDLVRGDRQTAPSSECHGVGGQRPCKWEELFVVDKGVIWLAKIHEVDFEELQPSFYDFIGIAPKLRKAKERVVVSNVLHPVEDHGATSDEQLQRPQDRLVWHNKVNLEGLRAIVVGDNKLVCSMFKAMLRVYSMS